ncbi:MAG: glutamine--tRNA ligase/YqeY domain fusion protein [Bacteroidetes bacterium]|nr:glutamine--tRNA ligase/YqeY domain fusion protein [Bacteroidota bacterium]
MDAVKNKPTLNFIEAIIDADLAEGKNEGKVHTRFPPEPNGYLHIGHAKSICLNFGLAKKYNGLCNLRFDDTNPLTEEVEYIESIKNDIRWLGFGWEKREYYASDYFDTLFDYAVRLIKKGKAYVCALKAEEVNTMRGAPDKPGKESPYRNRSVEENMDLFARMRNGEFPDGSCTLRAKIDMTSPNIHLRDPIMYRIIHASHHRTGNKWCIYPTYDFTHGQSDSIEKITHSICTLEFEVHRTLYDWYIKELELFPPKQYEFARLNLTYTVLSKRKLIELVEGGYVSGWDDPRLPTITGLRRRGYTPEGIRNFCEHIGVTKRETVIDIEMLEYFIRDDLNKRANRVMAVINPLRVILTNYPEDQLEEMEAVNNPEDQGAGTRKVPFSRVIYIERDDFNENPSKDFFRLAPGREVRLRYSYIIKYENVVKDEKTGEIKELHCSFDPESKSGMAGSKRKVKGVIHWVSVKQAISADVRLYDRLFAKPFPDEADEGKDFKSNLNPDSLKVKTCYIEPSVQGTKSLTHYQFERVGYFCVDNDSTEEKPVFNRTVTLKDSWQKKKQ